MNWLLFILRVVFGRSTDGTSDSPRVAMRSDGSTVELPSEASLRRRQMWPWSWLLPHASERESFFGAHSIVDELEHRMTRDRLGGGARRRFLDEFWGR